MSFFATERTEGIDTVWLVCRSLTCSDRGRCHSGLRDLIGHICELVIHRKGSQFGRLLCAGCLPGSNLEVLLKSCYPMSERSTPAKRPLAATVGEGPKQQRTCRCFNTYTLKCLCLPNERPRFSSHNSFEPHPSERELKTIHLQSLEGIAKALKPSGYPPVGARVS